MSEINSGHPMSTTRTNITGNAETANKLAAARNITVTGPEILSKSASFDGSENASLNLNGRLCVDLKNTTDNAALSVKYGDCYFRMTGGAAGTLKVKTVHTGSEVVSGSTSLAYLKGRIALYLDEYKIIPVEMTLQKHKTTVEVWAGRFQYNDAEYVILAVNTSDNLLKIVFFKNHGTTSERPSIPTLWLPYSTLKEAIGAGYTYYDESTNIKYYLDSGSNWVRSTQSEWFAVCDTDASTSAKTTTVSGFTFINGNKLALMFTKGSKVAGTLVINGTSKTITNPAYLRNISVAKVVYFTYNGTAWTAQVPGSVLPYSVAQQIGSSTYKQGFDPFNSQPLPSDTLREIIRAGLEGRDYQFWDATSSGVTESCLQLCTAKNILFTDSPSERSVILSFDIYTHKRFFSPLFSSEEADNAILATHLEFILHQGVAGGMGLTLLDLYGADLSTVSVNKKTKRHPVHKETITANSPLYIWESDLFASSIGNTPESARYSNTSSPYYPEYSTYYELLERISEAVRSGRRVSIVLGEPFSPHASTTDMYADATLMSISGTHVFLSGADREFILKYPKIYNHQIVEYKFGFAMSKDRYGNSVYDFYPSSRV